MRNAPLILLSPSAAGKGIEFGDDSISLSSRYPAAILATGGLPWILPCAAAPELVEECVRRCDGVMLTGGADVQPSLYRKSLPERLRRTVGPASPERDQLELLLIREALRQRRPLFAICRGQQILNVALGGTLIVDIAAECPGAVRHSRTDRKDRVVHEVSLTRQSLMATITRSPSLGVNSSHHQAVARVAGPLRVTARSLDGIVEALEWKPAEAGRRSFLLAVQFHPERLYARHEPHRRLFEAFVEACARDREKRL